MLTSSPPWAGKHSLFWSYECTILWAVQISLHKNCTAFQRKNTSLSHCWSLLDARIYLQYYEVSVRSSCFFPSFFKFFFFKLLVWKCFGKVSASCTAATLLCTGHWWPEASKSCREQQHVMITPVCSFGTHADQGLLWEFSPGTRISALLPAAQQCFCFAYLCRCCFGMAVPKHLAAGAGTRSQVCSCRQGTPASPPFPHKGAPNNIAYAFLPSRVSLVWLIFNPSTCWDNSTWGNQENLVPSC